MTVASAKVMVCPAMLSWVLLPGGCVSPGSMLMILIQPVGVPIYHFVSKKELMGALVDIVESTFPYNICVIIGP